MNLRLIIACIVLAAVAAAGWHYRAVVAERDAASQRAAAAETVVVAEKAARAKEQSTAKSDASAAAAYQEGLENGKVELQGSIARLRAQLRLRDQRAAGGNLPEASAGAGQRNGEASAEFSGAQREKLAAALERFGIEQYSIASDSDKAAKGLGACQVILAADRAE
ncbi:hypothetical protein [Chromobacterium haemolyticum]|uniref:hypothetical protein n=1 Tax=Chromobacterium haemolyticum TaxID=394935 RepID=UPI0005B7CBF9|nr:hypothetical protein [Chromobacterium haemolyticum]